MTDVENPDDPEGELFQGFLEESDEMLGTIEKDSIKLESNPSDLANIHSIFRAVHSLKGNSSFFNFENVKTFCHTLENFLDLIRDKKIEVDNDIVKFILEGADHLKAIFGRLHAANGIDVLLSDEERNYLKHIDDRVGPSSEAEKHETLRKELLRFFSKFMQVDGGKAYEESPVREVYELICKYAPDLVEERRESVNENGSKWMYGALDVTREYLILRNLALRAGDDEADAAPASTFMGSIDSLIKKHREAQDSDAIERLSTLKDDFEMFYQDEIGIDEMLAQNISTVLDQYASGLKEIKEDTKKDIAAAPQDEAHVEKEGVKRRTSFVRVDEALLDMFIDHVGELITLTELFKYIQRKVEENDLKGLATNFRNTNQSFRELSHQLQKSLYEIRKAPVERALAKLPRLVRNFAKHSGKSIKLTSTGGHTEVDKSMLEKIENFLVHLVRNSSDHGIETPEERKACGKNPEGEILIKISSDKLSIFLEVADDGRGVNLEKVRKEAVNRGFFTEDAVAKLSERETLNLLLKPGFSTAEVITETSGRGVGMDVLAASVHEMGGTIDLTNNPGKGLKIKVSTPLAYTTRIKLGLTLLVGPCIFLIPAESVRESFKISENDVTVVEGRGEMVTRWGKIYPVVRLHELFDITPVYEKIWDAICVLVESRGQTICLMVDRMLGQRQIVYKQLTVQTKEPSAFEGVSILDESRMALILSVEGIVKQFLAKK